MQAVHIMELALQRYGSYEKFEKVTGGNLLTKSRIWHNVKKYMEKEGCLGEVRGQVSWRRCIALCCRKLYIYISDPDRDKVFYIQFKKSNLGAIIWILVFSVAALCSACYIGCVHHHYRGADHWASKWMSSREKWDLAKSCHFTEVILQFACAELCLCNHPRIHVTSPS